jgi:hypothetical protein
MTDARSRAIRTTVQALVALAALFVLVTPLLSAFGIDIDPEIRTAIGVFLTGLVSWVQNTFEAKGILPTLAPPTK